MRLLRSVFTAIVLTLGPGSWTMAAVAQAPFGPDTCLQGYVWRDAFPDDHVCVTPETRAPTLSLSILHRHRQRAIDQAGNRQVRHRLRHQNRHRSGRPFQAY